MEYNYITTSHKQLRIGDLYISFYYCPGTIPFTTSIQIPIYGMAFYYPGEINADFTFRISNISVGTNLKLLYGSDNFMNPLFVYQDNNENDYIWVRKNKDNSLAMSFKISSDWREFTLYDDQTNSKGERAFHEFGALFSYAILNYHACVLHGVVMEYEGKGILVVAAAGTGKTTHTRMWRDYMNALIINGDRCLCRKKDGLWYAYGMPWSGSSGEYINRKVPISCIVNLNRGTENTVHLLSKFDGTLQLMQRVFAPVWSGSLQNKALDYCEELASEIPILDFYCRPDLNSVHVLKEAVMRYGR